MLPDLTESGKRTLKAEICKIHLIQGSGSQGIIKLEFYDAHGVPHAILINSSCVTKILSLQLTGSKRRD
jgi:hypothetical protein